MTERIWKICGIVEMRHGVFGSYKSNEYLKCFNAGGRIIA